MNFEGNDKDCIQWRLERVGGYDRHGNVFSIARPLTGSVSFPVKTFPGADALEQFINEFTFFRYGGCCPSWYSVLHESDCFSSAEKYTYTLKGKSYTPEGGKDYVIQLIGSGELVVHRTGSWIQPKDRNHHLPWPKSGTKREEFLLEEHRPMTLGPHEEPGYESPPSVELRDPEDIVPDKLTTAQRIGKLDLEGHAPIRHGGPNRVTDLQLEDRVVRGIDPASGTTFDAFNKFPNGSPKLHKVGRNATAFASDDALLQADSFARSSAQFQQNVAAARANGDLFVDAVELPLKDVFGSGYQNSVRGVTRLGSKKNPTGYVSIDFTDGSIKAIYRRDHNGNIKLHTLYPNPKF